MKVSEHWLREWVNPDLTAEQIANKLTLSGLEVEELSPVAEEFSKVIVGHVLNVEKHPQADRLKVCLVDVGAGVQLSIVCGAPNVREGIRVPVAMEAAKLPGDFTITQTKIRGVVSHGMLCSSKELGLSSEEGQGLFELPLDAPIGVELWGYLKLSDTVFNISITPNRGDCLSLLGLSKEVAALTQSPLNEHLIPTINPILSDTLAIEVQVSQECPRYVGRIIRGIKADATTPMWMQERLRRSGARCISPVVDVMNYVMFELGQPMHVFDLQKLSGGICVRKAKAGETLLLLDGNTAQLTKDTLVIADHHQPVAIAGVMGGLESSVTLLTQDIFLESAYFNPVSISKSVRSYGLNSESSYRFERGIDPTLQIAALERATQLLIEITGGNAAPLSEVSHSVDLPQEKIILLRKEKIDRLLGLSLSDNEIESLLERFNFHLKKTNDGWKVTVPARRSDITLEVDLIEEIIRAYGYEKIPLHFSKVTLETTPIIDRKISLTSLRHSLSNLGYQEVITYSFIDPTLQQLIDPEQSPRALLNPMTADMAVMRTSLWPGLINTLLYNQNRQQTRIRLFETGLRFITENEALKQESVVSGLISGELCQLQWANPQRKVDFFDLKGDLENLLQLTHASSEFSFRLDTHVALHPGQTAAIYRKEQRVGVLGALHPSLMQQFNIHTPTFLFELLLEPILQAALPKAGDISKFPEIRRDIAILIDKTIPSDAIRDTIVMVAGEFLREINIFDVYEGKGISPERKSLALALTLQHSSRTLIDEEIVSIMECVTTALKNKFAAELRG